MQRGLESALDPLDLGIINIERDPLLIFGGPYSNLQATQELLTLARGRGYQSHQIICTGDVVAYCANPQECVDVVRDAGIHVVMGNCEESLGFDKDDCGCGFDLNSACDVESRQWFTYANQHLDQQSRAWMRTLPRRITATIMDRRFSFIHGSASSISGWVFKSTPDPEKYRHLDDLNADAVIAGHCGLPFTSRLPDGRLWANAGVIGMPANDGTKRGWFSTLSADKDKICLKTEAFDYNADQSAQAMESAGLSKSYAKSLKSGLWPNMDVLPEAETGQCGIKINPELFHL